MKRKINTLLASDYKRYSSTREMPKFQKWMRKYQETDNRILKIIYRIIFAILRKRNCVEISAKTVIGGGVIHRTPLLYYD